MQRSLLRTPSKTKKRVHYLLLRCADVLIPGQDWRDMRAFEFKYVLKSYEARPWCCATTGQLDNAICATKTKEKKSTRRGPIQRQCTPYSGRTCFCVQVSTLVSRDRRNRDSAKNNSVLACMIQGSFFFFPTAFASCQFAYSAVLCKYAVLCKHKANCCCRGRIWQWGTAFQTASKYVPLALPLFRLGQTLGAEMTGYVVDRGCRLLVSLHRRLTVDHSLRDSCPS